MQRGLPKKKILAQAVSEKKKFVQAENSPPPYHFSNGPSLKPGHYGVLRPRILLVLLTLYGKMT